MVRASQLALERLYDQGFAKYCPLAPQGIIEFSDKPDIRVFGVEVTGHQLHLKNGKDLASEQMQSEFRSGVIRLSEADYSANDHPRYEFWFDFDLLIPITNCKELSRSVYQCVLEVIKEQRK